MLSTVATHIDIKAGADQGWGGWVGLGGGNGGAVGGTGRGFWTRKGSERERRGMFL